jgi:hypothetical protein
MQEELVRIARVNPRTVIRTPRRGTTIKTRILAGGIHSAKQQVVRIDREPAWPLSEVVSRAFAHEYWPGEDALGKRIRRVSRFECKPEPVEDQSACDQPGKEAWPHAGISHCHRDREGLPEHEDAEQRQGSGNDQMAEGSSSSATLGLIDHRRLTSRARSASARF